MTDFVSLTQLMCFFKQQGGDPSFFSETIFSPPLKTHLVNLIINFCYCNKYPDFLTNQDAGDLHNFCIY